MASLLLSLKNLLLTFLTTATGIINLTLAIPTSTPTFTPTPKNQILKVKELQTFRPMISTTPKPLPSPNKVIKPITRPTPDTEPWGVAKQIGEHTYTMKIQPDSRMATAKEILEALNEYRVRRGSQRLTWDDSLASFAQTRANFFQQQGKLDEHAGFIDYLKNQDGFNKLGFTSLGENSSYGYQLLGVHLVEWIYAGDKPHDDNQVDNRWNYVGIGINGTATALIFGTGRR